MCLCGVLGCVSLRPAAWQLTPRRGWQGGGGSVGESVEGGRDGCEGAREGGAGDMKYTLY